MNNEVRYSSNDTSELMEDTFPYKRYTMPDPPGSYFKRAQLYQPVTEERVLRVPNDEQRLVRPDQIMSRTSRRDFLAHFPLHFFAPEGQPRRALVIKTSRGAYDEINILPDYYTEDARVRDTGADQKISPYDYWNAHKADIIKASGGLDQIHEQRENLWKMGPTEARQGKITNYLTLFQILDSRIVLDPSAAWGDRLIAALASPSVEAYTGVDPHSRLPRGWQEILDELGPLSGKPAYRERFIMLNEPFQPKDATPLPEGMGNYDTVLISPPPLFGDQYDIGNSKQAVAAHGSSMRNYVRGFLVPYMTRAIEALKVGGYLCITVLDRPRDKYFITELQLLLTEIIGGGIMHYRGVIWWEGDRGGMVPWWIFVKSDTPVSRQRLAEIRKLHQPYADV